MTSDQASGMNAVLDFFGMLAVSNAEAAVLAIIVSFVIISVWRILARP